MTTQQQNPKPKKTQGAPQQQEQLPTKPAQVPCPRCDTEPVVNVSPLKICAACQTEEDAEARSGEEDARTAADARRADAQAQQAKQQEPQAAGQQAEPAAGAQQPAAQQQEPAKQAPANTPPAAQGGTAPAPRAQQQAASQQQAQSAQAAAQRAQQAQAQRGQQTQQQRPAGGQQQMPAGQRQAPQRVNRMTLESIKANAAEEAPILWIYGVEGIGKSTLAADTPSPIFLPGGKKSPNIRRKYFPVPYEFQDVMDAVDTLTTSEHEHKTLVFDDFDYVEGLSWDLAIRQYNASKPKVPAHSIEDVGGGYGRGYQASVDIFRRLIQKLERLRVAKNMLIVFISHANVKSYKNPTGNDYDRFVNSMNEKAVALFRKWCDAMLFVNYVDQLKHDWKAKKTFAEGDGRRVMFTQRRPTHDAKNRYDLPYEMALPLMGAWTALDNLIQMSREPEILMARIEEKIEQIQDDTIAAWVREQLASNPPVDRLSRINARLSDKLDELNAPPEEQQEVDEAAQQ